MARAADFGASLFGVGQRGCHDFSVVATDEMPAIATPRSNSVVPDISTTATDIL